MSFTDIQPWLLIACLIPLLVTIIRTRTVPGARFQWWTLYLAMVGSVLYVAINTFDALANGNPWILIPAAASCCACASAVVLVRSATRPLPEDAADAEAARTARARSYRIHSWVIGGAAIVVLVSVVVMLVIVPITRAVATY